MRSCVVLLMLITVAPVSAQQPPVVTADDYAHAERFLGYNTTPLVFGIGVRPAWLADGRFWYRIAIPQGFEYVLVDPAKRTRARLFDHAALAAALSRAVDTTFDAFHLPFTQLDLAADGKSIVFDAMTRRWMCDLTGGGTRCTAAPRKEPPRNAVFSPDSTRAAFIRDNNLWVREIASGQETQLTTDGVKDVG